MRRPFRSLILACLLCAGCGEDGSEDGWSGFVDEPDASGGVDAARDAPLADVSHDVAVDVPQADTPPGEEVTDACEGVDCGENATCFDGECECDDGYVWDADRCVPDDPGDPAARNAALVCQRFVSESPPQAEVVWHAMSDDPCDPGRIDEVAHEDAMRRLNFYRWLVGLAPAGMNADNQQVAQLAAMMMDVNGRLDHNPPPDWTCYSEEGARGAAMSNLALGYPSPTESIIGYIRDAGTPSLGHRRWIMFPNLEGVGFGHRGRGGAMYVFGSTSRPAPEFVAYPPPGPVPVDAIHGVWSFSRQGIGDPQVRVVDVDAGRDLDTDSTALQRGFGLDTVSITLRERLQPGTTYRVEVGEFSYETTPVNCP